MTSQFEFAKHGKVSVWYSTQPYDQVPEAYFQANEDGHELWAQNFNMTDVDLENIETNGVEQGVGAVMDIIAPCSYSSGYGPLVEHKIIKMGDASIAWVILLFDYEYRPKKTKIYKDDVLNFVGAYNYDMDDESLLEIDAD